MVERAQAVKKYIDLVRNTDGTRKELTRRSVKRLEHVTGIPRDKMFPPGKQTLYVGDPWQELGKEIDNEDLTIVDYEFAEAVLFVKDRVKFEATLISRIGLLIDNLNSLINETSSQKHSDMLRSLKFLLDKATADSKRALESNNYFLGESAWVAGTRNSRHLV